MFSEYDEIRVSILLNCNGAEDIMPITEQEEKMLIEIFDFSVWDGGLTRTEQVRIPEILPDKIEIVSSCDSEEEVLKPNQIYGSHQLIQRQKRNRLLPKHLTCPHCVEYASCEDKHAISPIGGYPRCFRPAIAGFKSNPTKEVPLSVIIPKRLSSVSTHIARCGLCEGHVYFRNQRCCMFCGQRLKFEEEEKQP